MKVLITGGKSAIALKVMKAFLLHQVLLADYGDIPSLSSSSYSFVSLGEKNEDTIAHSLLSSCLDHQADAILPLYSFEFEPLSKSDILFGEFGIEILSPDITSLIKFNDLAIDKKNWAVFKNGAILFSTEENSLLIDYGIANNLTGAFYHEVNENDIQLKLIAI